MEHTLEWFKERKSSDVVMITPDEKVLQADIGSDKEAFYYFDLQRKGFIFKEK